MANSWAQNNSGTDPGKRAWAGMIYDSAREVFLLVGGQDAGGPMYNDTLAYDGAT